MNQSHAVYDKYSTIVFVFSCCCFFCVLFGGGGGVGDLDIMNGIMIYLSIHPIYIYMFVSSSVCLSVCLFVCMYIYMHTCIDV